MSLAMLDLKLLRDLWRLRGQALATSLVVGAGVALFIMATGALDSIRATRDAYYDRYRLADVFATAKRAPLPLVARAAAIPGVRMAEGRVTGPALLDVRGFEEPVNGIAHSLPVSGEQALNAVHLVRGRLPDPARDDEVLLGDDFARAHGLASGDRIGAVMQGKRRQLLIVGTALSPEHVFTIPPGNLTADERRFAVLWLGRRAMEGAFDQRGAFNELLLALDRGAVLPAVLADVDRLLAPHGGTGAFGRADLVSDKFLRSELDQLAVLARLLPPMFLGVAAFLLWIMIGRVIDTERESIGLLKAFGYRDREVGLHYLKLAVAIALVGTAIGCLGGAWLGRGITGIYAQFYRFPFLIFRVDAATYAAACAISLGAALAGTIAPVRRATALSPAVAMQQQAPTGYASGLASAVARVGWLDEPSRMILRHLLRFPLRALLSVLGVGLAGGLCIAASFNLDAIDRMLEFSFDVAARQDATLVLAEPRQRGVLQEFARLPGVMAVEPFRAAPAKLRLGTREVREALTGMEDGARLSRLIDDRWRPVALPPDGIVLSHVLAERLGARPGSRIMVTVLEGRRPTVAMDVVRVVRTYQGSPAFIAMPALNRMLKEGPTVSGAYLQVDAAHEQALYAAVKQRPMIAGISLRSAVFNNFREQVRRNIDSFRLYNLALAAIMVVGVVYNNARLSFSERARELATMRVLGYRRREVSYVLLGELAVLTLLALPLGAAIGLGLAWYLAQSFSSEMYTIPFAVSTRTVGTALLTVVVAAAGTALVIRRRVDRLDLVRVLKSRE